MFEPEEPVLELLALVETVVQMLEIEYVARLRFSSEIERSKRSTHSLLVKESWLPPSTLHRLPTPLLRSARQREPTNVIAESHSPTELTPTLPLPPAQTP